MSELQDPPRASLSLLRRITDRHVVDRLLEAEAMTRAGIAAATGISKPTVSESVRRLEADGIVEEVGRAPARRRGPAGVHYALRSDLGVALALEGGPDGLVADLLDVRGGVLRHVERPTPTPVASAVLEPLLGDLVRAAVMEAPGPLRACSVSLAGPVDRATGRLVHLPSSPFLTDELDARAVFGPLLQVLGGGEQPALEVDNDVNWAALAEHDDGVAAGLDDFCYLHLGYGFGGAVVQGGRLVRGHAGLAGEPAHVITTGPGGRAVRLVDGFAELGLLRPGSDTVDVARVVGVLSGTAAADRDRREAVVEAVLGVMVSLAAFLNPSAIVVGGPWASFDVVGELATRARTALVPPTEVLPAALGTTAPLRGARVAAVRDLRSRLFDGQARDTSA